ncbi:MAG: hypothetical protein PQJ60_08980 [Spirochaetales bacterium]|nr:hypothetical protein [Spirochaetales bacterium]
MREEYKGYRLTALPYKTSRNRWAVSVQVERITPTGPEKERFNAFDGIEYILEVEAAKESLNLGRRMIDLGRVN